VVVDIVPVVADVSVVDIVPVADVSVVDIVPVVADVSVAIVSVAIVSVAPVSVLVVIDVSVVAVSVVVSSFLQPMASIETTKRAIRVRTSDFFMCVLSPCFSQIPWRDLFADERRNWSDGYPFRVPDSPHFAFDFVNRVFACDANNWAENS
jgi:hypothetical protein